MGSSFGKSTVPPTGTTTTRGLNALPFMVITTLAGEGGLAAFDLSLTSSM